MPAVHPHILVVDDDPSMRELIGEYLLDSSFRVSTAASGEKMNHLLRAHVIDLVLLDLRLPDHDGMQLIFRLRRKLSVHSSGGTQIRNWA